MKEQIKNLKQELKSITRRIRENKKIRKLKAKGHEYYVGDIQLMYLRKEYRLKHVAYCMVRGRTMEQVDSGKGLDMEELSWLISTMQPESTHKLYIVVSDKLSQSQQAVQSAHAVAEFMKTFPYTKWRNGHIVLLKDQPFRENMHCPYYCRKGTVSEVAEFKEPDLGNIVTAYAIFSPYTAGFKNLSLL